MANRSWKIPSSATRTCGGAFSPGPSGPSGGAVGGKLLRPLHIFSHWLVWRIAGPNPTVFHLYQLIFYVVTVLLVYRLGRELFTNNLAAYSGALLWALHPLHVEPVCWIAGVPDVGCGLFFVLAFLLFLRGRSSPSRAGSGTPWRQGLYPGASLQGSCHKLPHAPGRLLVRAGEARALVATNSSFAALWNRRREFTSRSAS